MRQLEVICEGEKEVANETANFQDTIRVISELLGKRMRLPAITQDGSSDYRSKCVKSNKHPTGLENSGTLRF